MAEREGFEPSVQFPVHTLYKRAPSTTRTSLRTFGISGLRASGSARNPNCDRNCDTPPTGLRSLTGGRALENAQHLQELLHANSNAPSIQGCLECGPTTGSRLLHNADDRRRSPLSLGAITSLSDSQGLHRNVDLNARWLSLIVPLEVHGVRPLVSRLLEVLPHRSPRLYHNTGELAVARKDKIFRPRNR